MPTIEVLVDTVLAEALAQSSDTATDARVVAESTGTPLLPRSYVAADGLPHHWYLELADEAGVDEVLERLRGVRGVEAAYVKPPDELP